MNLIFDFDGTLADSIDELVFAANSVITKFNQPPLTVSEIHTLGLRGIIKQRNLNKIQLALGLLYYRKRLASKVDTLNTFPNLIDTLKKLSHKHTLAVLTSNSRENVMAFLKHHKLLSEFSIIESEFNLFGKDRKLNKMVKAYKLSRSETFYIGDETRDIIAAKRARVIPIAVAWGFEDKKLLKKASPQKIILKPSSLLSLSR